MSKEWSFLNYMAGDNSLSDFGMRDIEEMQGSGSSARTSVAVEIDQAGDFDGIIRYEITPIDPEKRKADRIVKERLPEMDSGDPETLVDWLKWAKENYDAEHYFVVIWNHGSGFRAMRTDRFAIMPSSSSLRHKRRSAIVSGLSPAQPRSAPVVRRGTLFRHPSLLKLWKSREGTRAIASDDMTGNSLDMIELGTALRKAGFYDANKMDVLGFDACLMNLLEVAYEMSSNAHFLIGSEELEPGDGWPYTSDIKSLNNSNVKTAKLVKDFVRNYGNYYRPNAMRNAWPITQSAINLDLISQLTASVDNLGSALSELLPENTMTISNIRESVQSYAPAYDYDDYVDLGDLADLLKSNIDNEDLQDAANEVISNLKKVVVGEVHLGKDVQNSHGLTLWFPETADKYHTHKSAYRSLAMTKKYPQWDLFLQEYHPRKPKGIKLKRSGFTPK